MGIEDQRVTLRRWLSLILLFEIVTTGLLVALLFHYTGEMGTLFFALLAGGLGAAVSLARRSANLAESELNALLTSPWNLVIVALVSSVMAGIVYLLFLAGILTGDGGGGLFTSNLFPKFSWPAVPTQTMLDIPTVLKVRPTSIQDFGKLVVWCFLAGYSEKFAPGILGVLEKRAGGGEEKGEATHA